MNIRRLIMGAAAVMLAVGFLPASSAFAQDDLKCIQEEDRQTSHGFESTVVHFCARWQWNPPTTASHEGTGTGDHDPYGGKGGGTVEEPTCDSLKESLANAKEQLDLVNKQFDATEIWLSDVMKREATAKQTAYTATDTWSRAQDDVAFFFTAYEVANDLDDEIEVSPKNGVTIVRPAPKLRPNHALAFGIELDVAMHQEAAARIARDAAATAYHDVAEELIDAQSAYNNLFARRAALTQAIERLRARINSCQP